MLLAEAGPGYGTDGALGRAGWRSTQSLWMHCFLRVFGPPNFVLSLQLMHWPQSARKQFAHLPQAVPCFNPRPRLPSICC